MSEGLIPKEGPDMDNRDPNELNSHIKVNFEDVFGEPEGAHSHECVWNLAFKCFHGGKNCCYLFLTFICAVPHALCWGCEFACVAFAHIWQITPAIALCSINCLSIRKLVDMVLQACLAPCCETIGLLLSKIIVTSKSG